LIADDLLGEKNPKPTRYVIDFQGKDIIEAKQYAELFHRVEQSVLPDRKKAAENEEERNKKALAENPNARVNIHHANFLKKWWQLSYGREDMIAVLAKLPRYVVCSRVTKRPIFEFVDSRIRPNDALQVFPYADDYSFGLLQSGAHWAWILGRCSTLKSDFRYTSNTVFDSFPWPQLPTESAIRRVADAAVALRAKRNELRAKHKLSLRELYRSLDLPGENPLKSIHLALDNAVRAAYGMTDSDEVLAFLLELNMKLAIAEGAGQKVRGPGLPDYIINPNSYVTADSVTP
jgi:hypothetical protein